MLILRQFGLGVGDELGNRLDRHRGIHLHDIGLAMNTRDRRDVADEIEVELCIKRRVDRVRRTCKEKRVAVGRGTTASVPILLFAHETPGVRPGFSRATDDEQARLSFLT